MWFRLHLIRCATSVAIRVACDTIGVTTVVMLSASHTVYSIGQLVGLLL